MTAVCYSNQQPKKPQGFFIERTCLNSSLLMNPSRSRSNNLKAMLATVSFTSFSDTLLRRRIYFSDTLLSRAEYKEEEKAINQSEGKKRNFMKTIHKTVTTHTLHAILIMRTTIPKIDFTCSKVGNFEL